MVVGPLNWDYDGDLRRWSNKATHGSGNLLPFHMVRLCEDGEQINA